MKPIDAEATITLRDEELVVIGRVTLPFILDHHAFGRSEVEIVGARLDTLDEPPIIRDIEEWSDVETKEVEYALYEDAVNTVRSRQK